MMKNICDLKLGFVLMLILTICTFTSKSIAAQQEIDITSVVKDYFKAQIDGNPKLMYELSSNMIKSEKTEAQFTNIFNIRKKRAELLSILSLDEPLKIGKEIYVINARKRVKAHKKDGTEEIGSTDAPIYITLENGYWKVSTNNYLTDRSELFKLDIGKIASDLCYIWSVGDNPNGYNLPKNIILGNPVELIDLDGKSTLINDVKKWQKAEIARLNEYGEIIGPSAGEYCSGENGVYHLRSGFSVINLKGDVFDTIYDFTFTHNDEVKDAPWTLTKIKLNPKTPSRSNVVKIDYPDMQKKNIAKIKEDVEAELLCWKNKDNKTDSKFINKMVNVGNELESYQIKDVISMKNFYVDIGRADITLLVEMKFKKINLKYIPGNIFHVSLKDFNKLKWGIKTTTYK